MTPQVDHWDNLRRWLSIAPLLLNNVWRLFLSASNLETRRPFGTVKSWQNERYQKLAQTSALASLLAPKSLSSAKHKYRLVHTVLHNWMSERYIFFRDSEKNVMVCGSVTVTRDQKRFDHSFEHRFSGVNYRLSLMTDKIAQTVSK